MKMKPNIKIIKDPNVKTIRFPVASDQKLQTLADKCGLTKLDFFIAMVNYFYKSRKDPRDLNDELLKNELIKRTGNIIAFIKTMEEQLLKPLKETADKVNKSQYQIVEYFNAHIINHNKDQKEAYSKQLTSLDYTKAFIKEIKQAQLEKGLLKTKFSKILEYYIEARENMGFTTKQIEKDNLMKNVRQQLQNL